MFYRRSIVISNVVCFIDLGLDIIINRQVLWIVFSKFLFIFLQVQWSDVHRAAADYMKRPF